jgi:uncharacterized protein
MHSTSCVALALVLLFGARAAAASPSDDCRVGAYRSTNGEVLDIAPSSDQKLRWRRFDGTTGLLTEGRDGTWSSTAGWTARPDGLRARFDCDRGTLRLGARGARRIAFDVTETTFAARDISLAGRLVLPAGRERVPIVVLLHGSEDSSARDWDYLQRLLPAAGVGAFVYDKRGTGASGGTYTQDFELLAEDAVAALREARRLAGTRVGRIGYQGPSQGGWVAPLAARRSSPDFVTVVFGLAVTVIDEDLEAIELEMRLMGHGAETIAQAQDIARALHVVFASGFTQGFAEFDAVRARYRNQPWYADVRGNATRFFIGMSEAELRAAGPKFAWNTPLRYDPMPTLRALDVPQLWVLGEDDLDAPSAATARRLRTLIDVGHPITLALYPGAEHGMTEFELAEDGTRIATRYSEGYFGMLRDFARDGKLAARPGRAQVTRPRAQPTLR